MTTEVPTFYRISEAAAIVQVCDDTLRKEIREHRLIAKRIGRCLRVTNVELARWAADTSSPTGPTHASVPPLAIPDQSATFSTTGEAQPISDSQLSNPDASVISSGVAGSGRSPSRRGVPTTKGNQ